MTTPSTTVNSRGAPTASTQEVMMVQESMKVVGLYSGAVDGQAGPLTYRAVRAYKKRYHMAPDNSLNAEFISHLRECT